VVAAELSSVEIISRLLDVDLHTSTNNPDAGKHLQEFAESVRERIPELAGLRDRDIEQTVLDAFEEVLHSVCELDKESKLQTVGGATMTAQLFRCSHPDVGGFYVVKSELGYETTGESHLFLYASKDHRKAYDSYRREVEAIQKEYEELKTSLEEAGRSIEDEVLEYEIEL